LHRVHGFGRSPRTNALRATSLSIERESTSAQRKRTASSGSAPSASAKTIT
jgi:hypothetical protein